MARICCSRSVEPLPNTVFAIFFYGGTNGVAAELKNRLSTRFPGLNVVGIFEPPFRPLDSSEAAALETMVQNTRPDFFWVGLSTPKQEKFMAAFAPRSRSP